MSIIKVDYGELSSVTETILWTNPTEGVIGVYGTDVNIIMSKRITGLR